MKIDNKKLDLILANKCMSYLNLSEKSGISTTTLSRYRNKTQVARPVAIGKIAKALEVQAIDIVEGWYYYKNIKILLQNNNVYTKLHL